MSDFLDLRGLDRITNKLRLLGRLDASPLMATWMRIITEDNRKGVLEGTDKDGAYMVAVRYRPKRATIDVREKYGIAARWRRGVNERRRFGAFGGFGAQATGLHNNLSRQEYEHLDGPPLAPRRQFSRVITNLRTAYERSPDGKQWTAVGAWFEVVSTKGRKFLSGHFTGAGRLPIRNLAGVRPEGRLKARKSAVAWMSDQIRVYFGGRSAA